MEPPSLPRFEASQRRAFLKRAAAVGALALIPGLASCGSSGDKKAFGNAATTTASGAASTTTAPNGGTTSSTAASATTGDALPDGAALAVAFTWAASGGGGGPDHNPFIAVWVENIAGDLIANVSVWYNPPKGDRWVNNLASWYSAVSTTSSSYLETTTGATRAAGTYSLSWDGIDTSGARAAQGDYVLLIEAAQEHGTHSLTSAPITLGGSGTEASLADDGDLSAASATYTA
jgi:hypothetical protein